jgi:uncharacterized lipoprotein YmbA
MIPYRFICLPLVSGLIFLLAGCFGTSLPTRFYTLSPPENRSGPAPAVYDAVLAVGPVNIPDYLDRRQIVSRTGQNGIVLAEFDQWGGSLDDEINRVLVTAIAERLASQHIAVLFGKFPAMAVTGRDYRIPVKVSRFDGVRGGTVVLNAVWSVVEKRDKLGKYLFTQESAITEDVAGNSYEALVAAMGRAVGKLGREMADRLAPLIPKGNP